MKRINATETRSRLLNIIGLTSLYSIGLLILLLQLRSVL